MAPKTFSNESLRRCDQFYQIFVQIGANLAIFQPFEISIFFETSNGRLPLEISSDGPQTWPKRVSDDPRRFIFRRQTKIFRRNVRVDVCCVYTRYTCVLCTALHRVRPLPHCVGSWGGTGDPTLFHLGGGRRSGTTVRTFGHPDVRHRLMNVC